MTCSLGVESYLESFGAAEEHGVHFALTPDILHPAHATVHVSHLELLPMDTFLYPEMTVHESSIRSV